jgi:hypothetical protein
MNHLSPHKNDTNIEYKWRLNDVVELIPTYEVVGKSLSHNFMAAGFTCMIVPNCVIQYIRQCC